MAVPTMVTYDQENTVEIGDQESIDNDTALKTVQRGRRAGRGGGEFSQRRYDSETLSKQKTRKWEKG